MVKLKFLLILVLGLISFLYNFLNGSIIELFNKTDYSTFIQTHLGLRGQDNYIGILFDYLISIIFNINIKDITSFFRIFGG